MLNTNGILIPENKEKYNVFVSIYTKSANIYKDYNNESNKKIDIKIPMTIMVLRWDGCIGFPGGIVENNPNKSVLENIEDSLVREFIEEVNFDLYGRDFNLLTCYEKEDSCTTNWSLEVDFITFSNILRTSPYARDYFSEGAAIPVHLIEYPNGKGLPMFLNNNFKATAKDELIELVKLTKEK